MSPDGRIQPRKDREPYGRGRGSVPRAAAVKTIRFTRMFCGYADKVREVRHEVARHLTACGYPRVDDAVLIISEFCANAVLHSDSRGPTCGSRWKIWAGSGRQEILTGPTRMG